LPQPCQQIRQAHPGQGLKEAGTCAAISGDVAGDLVDPAAPVISGRDDRDFVHVGERRASALTISGMEVKSLSINRRLVIFLERFGFHVHRLGFGPRPFLKMISASASPFARMADAWPSASAVRRCFSAAAGFRCVAARFRLLEDSCDQSFSRRLISASWTLTLAFFFDLLQRGPVRR